MQLLIDTGFPRLSLVQKGKLVLPFNKDNSFAAVARRAVFSTFFFRLLSVLPSFALYEVCVFLFSSGETTLISR